MLSVMNSGGADVLHWTSNCLPQKFIDFVFGNALKMQIPTTTPRTALFSNRGKYMNSTLYVIGRFFSISQSMSKRNYM